NPQHAADHALSARTEAARGQDLDDANDIAVGGNREEIQPLAALGHLGHAAGAHGLQAQWVVGPLGQVGRLGP
ncbi:hypothetical protein, partial [Pantoea agglomerans]|uniref:hypothetical protein n=1 Tax=Enterobacter agglomerans TaxID=549 RepID=UPI003CE9CC29